MNRRTFMQNINLPTNREEIISPTKKRMAATVEKSSNIDQINKKRTFSLEKDTMRLEIFGSLNNKIKKIKSIKGLIQMSINSIGISRSGKRHDMKKIKSGFFFNTN
jgi:hypothetical protein